MPDAEHGLLTITTYFTVLAMCVLPRKFETPTSKMFLTELNRLFQTKLAHANKQIWPWQPF